MNTVNIHLCFEVRTKKEHLETLQSGSFRMNKFKGYVDQEKRRY